MHPLPPFIDPPEEYTRLDRSRVVVLPVPYERTTTYLEGTAAGPAAILRASAQVEWYDEVLEAEPFRVGIHTLPFLETGGEPAEVIERIGRRVADLPPGRLVVLLGGEHTVTLGALGALARRREGLGLLVLDAHDDLRDEYRGSRLNHACVSRRAAELVPVVQVGVRSAAGVAPPRGASVHTFHAHRIRRGMPADEILALLPEKVYLSVDADVFDPACCPGVGTPEPGGLDWYQVTDLVAAVAAERRIVGLDVVEVRPIPGQVTSEFLAARLVYRAIGLIARAAGWLQ